VIPSAWLPPIPGPVFKRLIFAEMQIALGRYIPETVSIELTRQNSSKYSLGTVVDELDANTVKRIIDEALEYGTFILTFTENDPLLRGEVFELIRSEEHTSELQSRENLVCRLLLEKKKIKIYLILYNHLTTLIYHTIVVT